ncbi:MAG: response regulator [Rubrivivax sp.]|nr:response regulator [Rubrivivax sp.]
MPERGPRREGSRWLAAIGLALVAAFCAIGWVQWRQVQTLDTSVRYEGDNLLWSFLQLESEFLRLRDQLREAVRNPRGTEDEAAQLRQQFEIFASRLPLVDPARVRQLFVLDEQDRRSIDQLHQFVTAADPWLAETVSGPLEVAPLRPLVARLDAAEAAVHGLTLRVNQLNAEVVARRNDASGQLVRQGIGLTLFQSLLTLAFVGIAWHQVRALAARRRALETLAADLDQARRQAEAASEAKSAFLANMSHELRTPFNGLLGMLTLLEASRLDAQQLDNLRTARQSAEHLLGLLNDILDIAKLESGRLELVPAPTALHRVLDGMRALMTLPAESKGLRLAMRCAPEVPPWVTADELRLKQILFNLLGNAIKFTERGEVGLEAEWQDGALVVTVHDTGIGIPPETLQRLFTRFVQGDGGIGKRFGGTGLGLEISRSLARMMGGDIQAHSTPGEGSRFVVRLPLPPCDEPAAPAAEEAATPAAAGRALDVLVVDDQAVNRSLLAQLLGRMGHRVRQAEQGEQAVEAVQAQPPDLVLMDLHMPVLDGLGATARIRALEAPAGQVRIVALTADAFRETRERMLGAGMDAFLTKPLQLPDLRRQLVAVGGRFELDPPAPEAAASPVEAPRPARRRRAGVRLDDVGQLLDMVAVGELWAGIGLQGYRRLLLGFLSDKSGSLESLRSALREPLLDELKPRGHAVKGTAGSLGLCGVQAQARRIELEGAGWDEATCQAQVQALDDLLERTRALVENMGLLD